MTTANNGGPAFPVTDVSTTHRIGVVAVEGITDTEERDRIYTAATVRAAQGMTLRDYFAAKALQGYLASFDPHVDPVEFATKIAEDATRWRTPCSKSEKPRHRSRNHEPP